MITDEQLTFEDRPHALIAIVRCERLDYMIIDTLKRRMGAKATLAAKYNVILDLEQVGHIPSMLMGALVDMLSHLREEGRRFVLVGMNRHIRASFKLTRIDILFEIIGTRKEALRALTPGKH